ncbi:17181_t:CDS:1, partial [Racocetra fulgida]
MGEALKKNEMYALGVANYLNQKQKYNNALKIYDILSFKAK